MLQRCGCAWLHNRLAVFLMPKTSHLSAHITRIRSPAPATVNMCDLWLFSDKTNKRYGLHHSFTLGTFTRVYSNITMPMRAADGIATRVSRCAYPSSCR